MSDDLMGEGELVRVTQGVMSDDLMGRGELVRVTRGHVR